MHLLKSNTLNLNRDTLGQLLDSNTAASRLVSEELLVGSVHFGEVGHVSEEDLGKRKDSVSEWNNASEASIGSGVASS